MAEILEGLDDAQRDRIAALRARGRFFWIDASLAEASAGDLGDALDVPKDALQALLRFGEDLSSARRFHADGKHVVFAVSCYLESTRLAAERPYRLRPVEVHVLVSGDYVLTLHQEQVSLPQRLTPNTPEGRSERYVVYAILDAMVGTAFDALDEVEAMLDDLAVISGDLRAGRVRMATLQAVSSRLARLRRRSSAERGLFDRIGVELERVEGLAGDDERYFDHLGGQANRLVDEADAAGNALATLIDLRLNETSYWLTVVATIFLPLTFVTGFFGMNFGWMVDQIDGRLAFWLLGVGTLVAGVALVVRLVARGSPVEPDPGASDAG